MYRNHTRKLRLIDVYNNIFPWRNLDEFFTQIRSTIAYRSPDNSLIAICKPFGVGTFATFDNNTSIQNQDKILYNLRGHPKYCIQDILEPLTCHFESKTPYKVIKGIDRYMSGLVLLSNNYDKHRQDFLRATSNSRIEKEPPFGFRAITSGYPVITGDRLYERVGIELVEVDELGDYKEPIIVQNANPRRFKSEKDKNMIQAELLVKKINRETSSSLVELYCSKLRSDFPRCYISSKTSFILGDVHFSKRIREILGRPMQVSAFKSSHRYDDNYEPLNSKLRNLLGVYKNATIPLMLDLHVLRLKGFDRKTKGKSSRDLIIQSPFMPVHFALTAARLKLLADDEVALSNYNYDAGLDSCDGGVVGGSGKGIMALDGFCKSGINDDEGGGGGGGGGGCGCDEDDNGAAAAAVVASSDSGDNCGSCSSSINKIDTVA